MEVAIKELFMFCLNEKLIYYTKIEGSVFYCFNFNEKLMKQSVSIEEVKENMERSYYLFYRYVLNHHLQETIKDTKYYSYFLKANKKVKEKNISYSKDQNQKGDNLKSFDKPINRVDKKILFETCSTVLTPFERRVYYDYYLNPQFSHYSVKNFKFYDENGKRVSGSSVYHFIQKCKKKMNAYYKLEVEKQYLSSDKLTEQEKQFLILYYGFYSREKSDYQNIANIWNEDITHVEEVAKKLVLK